ncbi:MULTISPECIES: hypothetical protein [Enterococcaceae]|uniref:hypothetical protein n=1 Tax=Enterococcaceae TaxID=81852 RepID=UPI000E47BECE|nr:MULTISPECIES: hypothetical protein [Enterococcaceae]MCI0131079.1 hypothetical protein [Vagococcus sp. CY53-2]RGI29692.1 hypothetical protein DXC12_07385 [Melissococcus sp. OM08-11BH]UNM89697.1 hypothetical protein MN187_00970 [Vagococcus sp. CY52-2]
MKKSTKCAIVATGVIGLITITKLTKRGIEKTTESVNRLKYKLLVKDKLQDNQNLLDIIDELDDEELKTMVSVFERLEVEPTESHIDSLKSKLNAIKTQVKA